MNFIFLILAGSVGLFLHWFKRWARGQVEADFITYMSTQKRHSIASVTTLLGAIVAMYTMGGDVNLTKQTLALAFMAGYGIDSAVNKAAEDN